MAKVLAVCISEKKGTGKKNIGSSEFIKDYGLKGDAHAGNWHRQVSLLSYDRINEFREKGVDVNFGDFGENLVADEIDFKKLPVGARLVCSDVELEVTQIGKHCHKGCAIYDKVGDCIMPREGVFAVVIKGGTISVGDDIFVKEV